MMYNALLGMNGWLSPVRKKENSNSKANYAELHDPRSRPVIHKTQIKQFIVLKVHYIHENPCLAIE